MHPALMHRQKQQEDALGSSPPPPPYRPPIALPKTISGFTNLSIPTSPTINPACTSAMGFSAGPEFDPLSSAAKVGSLFTSFSGHEEHSQLRGGLWFADDAGPSDFAISARPDAPPLSDDPGGTAAQNASRALARLPSLRTSSSFVSVTTWLEGLRTCELDQDDDFDLPSDNPLLSSEMSTAAAAAADPEPCLYRQSGDHGDDDPNDNSDRHIARRSGSDNDNDFTGSDNGNDYADDYADDTTESGSIAQSFSNRDADDHGTARPPNDSLPEAPMEPYPPTPHYSTGAKDDDESLRLSRGPHEACDDTPHASPRAATTEATSEFNEEMAATVLFLQYHRSQSFQEAESRDVLAVSVCPPSAPIDNSVRASADFTHRVSREQHAPILHSGHLSRALGDASHLLYASDTRSTYSVRSAPISDLSQRYETEDDEESDRLSVPANVYHTYGDSDDDIERFPPTPGAVFGSAIYSRKLAMPSLSFGQPPKINSPESLPYPPSGTLKTNSAEPIIDYIKDTASVSASDSGYSIQETFDNILLTKKDEATDRFHCPHPGCEQSFTRRYNLKTHFLASHIGERNFVCPICDVGFARKYDLIRHGSLKKHQVDVVVQKRPRKNGKAKAVVSPPDEDADESPSELPVVNAKAKPLFQMGEAKSWSPAGERDSQPTAAAVPGHSRQPEHAPDASSPPHAKGKKRKSLSSRNPTVKGKQICL